MQHKILRAAVDVADEAGLGRVSMRAVADRVGISAMSLYPHVSSKDALLDGMVDVLLAELLRDLEQLPGDADWWTRLSSCAEGIRRLARRHPSAFSLLLSRPSVTPDAVRVTDLVYQAVLDAGIPEPHVARVERLLSTFALGFAASEVNGRFDRGTLNPRARRAQLEPTEVPAHYRLAERLEQPVDWNAEFEADLLDLRTMIEALASTDLDR